MILVGGVLFAIVPSDNPISIFMREFDPEHIELFRYDRMSEGRGDTGSIRWGWWGFSLPCAQMMYGNTLEWLCPD